MSSRKRKCCDRSGGTESVRSVKNVKVIQNITNVHEDLLTVIFNLLDNQSKGKAAQVCSRWNEMLQRKSFWKDTEIELTPAICTRSTYDSIVARGVNRFYLRQLKLIYCEFLSKMSNINHLRITHHCINCYFSRCLKSVPTLKALTLYNFSEVSDKVLKVIVQHLPVLEELNLTSFTKITDNNLLILSNMENLKTLYVSRCVFFPLTDISDVGIRYLTGSYGVEKEKGIVSLERLYLRQTINLTNNALQDISLKLVNLVYLDLTECKQISDVGIKHLMRLHKLQVLDLAYCSKITDVGLKYITKLENLSSIDLTCCFKITDAGLLQISQLRYLKYLTINFCTRITGTCIENLRQLQFLQLDCSKCYINKKTLVTTVINSTESCALNSTT